MADGDTPIDAPFGNWGRWGAGDERGAANAITPELVRNSCGSVRDGEVLSLALPIEGATSGSGRSKIPHLAGRPLPQHFMSVDGGDYAAGSRQIKGEMSVADDALIVSPHGTTTHVDALSHMWRGDKLYNGHDAGRVRSYGATRCGIEKLGPLVTRGVLLDVAGYRGVGALEKGVRIDAELLRAVADAQSIEVRAGDVVLVRTGWITVFADDPVAFSDEQPGLCHSGATWLLERDVVAIGSDNVAVGALDPCGSFHGSVDEDVHMAALWQYGAPLIEMLWLEDLAATARHEFLFVLAPLAIVGGTASPVNPLAVL
ncbi:cyclase family protein [Gordonia rubripertincta]|uniref:Cyclase family protein n=1 Tax=Gordonia rubripertincta TaxID=36822 RepID=A0ABT4MNN8_GORRU|nr:cyclase family protein [Gordonia rubripertincta]MCZ4548616.1 cyclase family protein [Gordonia rubripertincta]